MKKILYPYEEWQAIAKKCHMTGIIGAGYAHALYAKSLSEFGRPLGLPRCGGWLLERKIPDFPYRDAMGCYPLFSCSDWSKLHEDLENIGDRLVSVALVTDPFGEYDEGYLKQCFGAVIPFKEHFVIDLGRPPESFVSKSHLSKSKEASLRVRSEREKDPIQLSSQWCKLYNNLIDRHNIRGIAAFSPKAFDRQLRVPGIEAFSATHKDEIVGMTLWYVHQKDGYYHLGAYSEQGYQLQASFAMFSFAIKYFADLGLRQLLLGAGAGLKSDGGDGLTRFKKGWSTGIRKAYFCGRIFDPAKYDEIVKAKGAAGVDYFPAYRKGEFS